MIGYINWNEKFGPEGKMWADDVLVPTLQVWDSNPPDPPVPELYQPGFTLIEGVMTLENRLNASLFAEVDPKGLWKVDLLFWVGLVHPAMAAVEQREYYPVVFINGEARIVDDDPVHKYGILKEACFDPEDGEELFRLLKAWSSIKIVDERTRAQ